MSEQVSVCEICGQPVLVGQPRYSVTENHYDCESPRLRRVEETIKAAYGLIDRDGKPRKVAKRVGEGRTALRLKQRCVEEMERRYEGVAHDVKIWGQLGGYRGAKWDLARWGVDMKIGCIYVSIHSWDRMTSSAYAKRLYFSHEDGHNYDCGPDNNPTDEASND